MSAPARPGTPIDAAALRSELKALLVARLRLTHVDPASIGDQEPLAGGSLGLDSIDMLELVLAVEERYGMKMADTEAARAAFRTIATLAGCIAARRNGTSPGGGTTEAAG